MRFTILDDQNRVFVEYDFETVKKLLKEYVQGDLTMNIDEAMNKLRDDLWDKVRRM